MIVVTVQSHMTAEQLNACAAIVRSLPEWFGDADAVSAYLNELPKLDVYLARRSGEVVGFASIRRNSTHGAEIHFMAVARKHRRLGVGRALVKQIVVDPEPSGVKLLGVQTLGSSDPSPSYAQTRAFYGALGFFPLMELQREDWTDPTLIMVLSLSNWLVHQTSINQGRSP